MGKHGKTYVFVGWKTYVFWGVGEAGETDETGETKHKATQH